MLSRRARWTGAGISNGRQRLLLSTTASRSYSCIITQSRLTPRHTSRRRLLSSPHSSTGSRALSLFGWTPSKSSSEEFAAAHSDGFTKPAATNVNDYATSTPSAAPIESIRTVQASHSTSDIPGPSVPIQDSPTFTHEPQIIHDIQDTIATPFSDQAPVDVPLAITEKIGFLKEIGLDYGWGTSSLNEYILEHLHISAGLTWGTSFIALALMLRLAIWPLTMRASEHAARLRIVAPEMKPVKKSMQEALTNKDHVTYLKEKAKFTEMHAKHGIKMGAMFMPIALQIPLAFGAFRAIRGMSTLPVPSLDAEPFYWISSLTAGDPYYFLPVLSSACIYVAIKTGSPEMGSGDAETEMAGLQKVMKIAFPIGNFVFMCFQPGALQLYFTTTAFFAAFQAWLLRNTTFRKMARMTPFPAIVPKPIKALTSTPPEEPEDEEIAVKKPQVSVIDKAINSATSMVAPKKGGIFEQFFGSQEARDKEEAARKAARYEKMVRDDENSNREWANENKESQLQEELKRSPVKMELQSAVGKGKNGIFKMPMNRDGFKDGRTVVIKPKKKVKGAPKFR